MFDDYNFQHKCGLIHRHKREKDTLGPLLSSNNHVLEDDCIIMSSTTLWSYFLGIIKKRFSFTNLLSGLKGNYPLLEEKLYEATQPIKLGLLQTIFEHFGIPMDVRSLSNSR